MPNMSLLRYRYNKKIMRSRENQPENKMDNLIMLHTMNVTHNISHHMNKKTPCQIQNYSLKNDCNNILKSIINIRMGNPDMCEYNYYSKKRFFDMVKRYIRRNRKRDINSEHDQRDGSKNKVEMKKWFFSRGNNNNNNNNNYDNNDNYDNNNNNNYDNNNNNYDNNNNNYDNNNNNYDNNNNNYDNNNNRCYDNAFFIHDKQRDMKHLHNDSTVLYNITYLIRKIEKNEKIQNDISIISLLFLCEQFFYIINTNIITSQYLSYIKNIYNNMNIKKKKKMYLIFLILKIFIYFLQLNIQHFYVTVMRQNDLTKNKNKKKIKNDDNIIDDGDNDDNIYINTFKQNNYQHRINYMQAYYPKNNKLKYYFDLFLDSFNFFHNAFLIYVSSFIFSFLDIQIAIDLTHYILFYL
ncbi:hypothetical protein PFDG_03221 [Plasmodium falciparum Dd2]|uniref:Uncharacterized protein n=1 Tax=Plasmodium falciparum (isolate Dd2) TaxID=57267 RepID=A0A0L7M2W8_PLAF4|nr:hypothetical protein PFDG_03221 [Plasmodium falciparum Dd2]